MIEPLLGLIQYRDLANKGEIIPQVPQRIEKFQTPATDISRELNEMLMRIFDDSNLHAAVRAYGKRLTFAVHETKDQRYLGFLYLALDSAKRMILAKKDRVQTGELTYASQFREYALFMTESGVFYARNVEYSGRNLWNEAVLASNEMAQHPEMTSSNLHRSLEIAVANAPVR